MDLTADAQALLLGCSHLGLSGEASPKPLNLREWNSLARRLLDSSLKTPGALLGLAAEELAVELDLPEHRADRLATLLSRGGGLAIELERLESLGIWVVTRADAAYPPRLRQRLKQAAPIILFGAGERALLGQPGLAVVGSRNVDEKGKACARLVGNACGREGLVLYSGGARGVDTISTHAALEARGTAVSALAQSLERAIRTPDARERLIGGDLALVTPYSPNAGFSVGLAMGRNKLIYALADYALVVAADEGRGGTWAGATEALRGEWVPVFVLDGPDAQKGNRALLERGGLPFPASLLTDDTDLRQWLDSHAAPPTHQVVQPPLL